MWQQFLWIFRRLLTVPHDILLCKLSAYGLSPKSVELLRNYLTGCKQQIKLQGDLSSWLIYKKGYLKALYLAPCYLNFLLTTSFIYIYIKLSSHANKSEVEEGSKGCPIIIIVLFQLKSHRRGRELNIKQILIQCTGTYNNTTFYAGQNQR